MYTFSPMCFGQDMQLDMHLLVSVFANYPVSHPFWILFLLFHPK